MQKPRSLRRGDKIGIVAPASPVHADDLEQGITLIKARGYQVEIGAHVFKSASHCDYLAGTDAERAKDLNELFERSDIAAIFCARGGYGSLRLLDLLNWEIIRANPKLFNGYSDITTLHLALQSHADLITFHGPMVAALPKLDETASENFWYMMENQNLSRMLTCAPEEIETIVSGTAEGELAGGCLCLLAHACGSRYAPDFQGKIVLIEDVNDAVYHADRDLIQLRNAGHLEKAVGFVVGTLTHWQKHEADPPRNTPEALWQDVLAPLGKPVISGFPFGHQANPLTLPLGIRARLDADAKMLTLEDVR